MARPFLFMRILIFSVFPFHLFDYLGEHLARAGHDVINLAGKRSRGRSSPGVRRVIMNFDEGGAAQDFGEAWKQALKNGFFGLKAFRNIASAWLPDAILCRSGQGAAFFIRQVFPEAFLASFAADEREAGIGVELDSRLFLESDLRFAPDARTIVKFPPVLRQAILTEPVCIDAEFFRPGLGGRFSCWKLDSGAHKSFGIVLAGLANDELQAWFRALVETLARDRKRAAVAVTGRRGVSALLLRALEAMPGGIRERVFVTDYLERERWRDLCASIPVVFTSEAQKRLALECVASGGSAWIAAGAGLADVPGSRHLRQGGPAVLREAEFRPADSRAIEAVRREYDCARVIAEFAERILAEYGKTAGGG